MSPQILFQLRHFRVQHLSDSTQTLSGASRSRWTMVTVSPALQDFCEKILERARDVRAVLIGTTDGTPIVNALRQDVENKSFTAHLERELAQHFAMAAVQAEKMGMGNLRYTVTFYPQACLVHVNLAPLVVTLVHKDGDGDTPNFGYALDMIPELTSALEPLRKQIREVEGVCRDDRTAA